MKKAPSPQTETAGRSGAAVGPTVCRVPNVHVGNLAKQAGLDQFNAATQVGRGAALVAGLRDYFRRAGEISQIALLGNGVGQRFFAENMFTGFHGGGADRGVPVIWRADHHRVE